MKVLPVLKAIRLQCLDCCAGDKKFVTWCTCDGIHSTRCEVWPFRFGCKPEAVIRKYGPQLVTPEMMPGDNVPLEDLPPYPEKVARVKKEISEEKREELRARMKMALAARHNKKGAS